MPVGNSWPATQLLGKVDKNHVFFKNQKNQIFLLNQIFLIFLFTV